MLTQIHNDRSTYIIDFLFTFSVCSCFNSNICNEENSVIKVRRDEKRTIVERKNEGYHVGRVTSYHGLLTKWPLQRIDIGSPFQ